MYTGKYFDSSTGMYYYNARFYYPATQRFMTEDSYTDSSSDVSGQNRYLFANQNPETNNDPTGHYVSCINCGPSGLGFQSGSWSKLVNIPNPPYSWVYSWMWGWKGSVGGVHFHFSPMAAQVMSNDWTVSAISGIIGSIASLLLSTFGGFVVGLISGVMLSGFQHAYQNDRNPDGSMDIYWPTDYYNIDIWGGAYFATHYHWYWFSSVVGRTNPTLW